MPTITFPWMWGLQEIRATADGGLWSSTSKVGKDWTFERLPWYGRAGSWGRDCG